MFYYHHNSWLFSYDLFYCGNKACWKLHNSLIWNTVYVWLFHRNAKELTVTVAYKVIISWKSLTIFGTATSNSGERKLYLCKTQQGRPNLHLTRLVRDRLLGLGLAIVPPAGYIPQKWGVRRTPTPPGGAAPGKNVKKRTYSYMTFYVFLKQRFKKS